MVGVDGASEDDMTFIEALGTSVALDFNGDKWLR